MRPFSGAVNPLRQLTTPLARSTTRITLPARTARTAQSSKTARHFSESRIMSAAVEPGSPNASGSGSRSAAKIPGPVESSMQTKLVEAFQPTLIRISNDSSKHAHHSAMRAIGGGNGETHFAVSIISESFVGKSPIQRHRLVNNLLKDEFETMGLHALSLRLKTPEEWEKEVDVATAKLNA